MGSLSTRKKEKKQTKTNNQTTNKDNGHRNTAGELSWAGSYDVNYACIDRS